MQFSSPVGHCSASVQLGGSVCPQNDCARQLASSSNNDSRSLVFMFALSLYVSEVFAHLFLQYRFEKRLTYLFGLFIAKLGSSCHIVHCTVRVEHKVLRGRALCSHYLTARSGKNSFQSSNIATKQFLSLVTPLVQPPLALYERPSNQLDYRDRDCKVYY